MKSFILKVEDLVNYESEQVIAGHNGRMIFAMVKHYLTKAEVKYKLVYWRDNNPITEYYGTLESAVVAFNYKE